MVQDPHRLDVTLEPLDEYLIIQPTSDTGNPHRSDPPGVGVGLHGERERGHRARRERPVAG